MTEDRTTPQKQQRRLSLLPSFLVVVLPIIIASVLYDPTTVVTGLIHLHFVHWPTRIWPLDNPERDFGLVGARNYRIRSGDADLGLWHVPPADGTKGKRVVVYFHGQAGAREHGHRVELYRHLSQDMDTHVVTADLRGYGDSTGFPYVQGIAEDIKTVTDWAIDNVARKLD
ncbi:Monoacylglycerol lipase abhd12, partial [Perkinsus olseni]